MTGPGWLRRLGRLALGAFLGALGCGPEPREPSPWMIGAFSSSNSTPGNGFVTQYHLHDDLTLDAMWIDSTGVKDHQRRTWEPRGADELAVFPNDGDSSRLVEWRVRRTTEDGCGSPEVERIYETMIETGGRWYPGTYCVVYIGLCEEHGNCIDYDLEACDAQELCDEAGIECESTPPECEQ